MTTPERRSTLKPDPERFAQDYVNRLCEALKNLDLGAIEDFVCELEAATDEGATVFIAGNGGSASTASHMANDLAMGTRSGVVNAPMLRAVALTDNVSIITAVANDTSYSRVFVEQLHILFKPGDRLIAISASGNSENVLAAAAWVKERGGRVVGLLGFDGGKLQDLCDVAVHVRTPVGEYGIVESVHVVIDHLATEWLLGRSGATSQANDDK